MPNILGEIVLTVLRFAALWVLFFMLYHPQTKVRRIFSLVIMAFVYPFHRILFFASGGNFAAGIAFDVIILLILAFLCEEESSENPDEQNTGSASGRMSGIIRPIISAVYFNGIVQMINYLLFSYTCAFAGSIPPSFSFWSYFGKSLEGAVVLLWTLFYYRVSRSMTAKAPISFSLLTVLTPFAGLAVIAVSTNATTSLLEHDVNVFLYGALFGTLILVLNMCVLYLYTKLSVAYEALRFAQAISPVPPVWTAEQGVSAAFIDKYEISPRERDVIEALLLGKTDKEIAGNLNIAVNTVQVHLKRIYRKTGASGRFALSALVRGRKV